MTSKLEDLDFADDIALISANQQQMQEKTAKLNEIALKVGLRINQKKTKVLRLHSKNSKPIEIQGNQIEEVKKLKIEMKKCEKIHIFRHNRE